MSEQLIWREAIANVIRSSISSVRAGRPHDASAWIELEEFIGEKQTERVWRDKEYGPVVKALDYYCFAAQHDESKLGDGLTIDELANALTICADILEQGRHDFPSIILKFT